MGRDSRGVLLLVALAVLAAADAFSTDSKFSIFVRAPDIFGATMKEKGKRGGERG